MCSRNNKHVICFFIEDLKANKINSLNLLDKVEEEVEAKFHSLDKLMKSIVEFEEKIIELEDYKYLLFKAREIFSGSRRD